MAAADESTIGGIAELVQDRLEESRGTLANGLQYWNYTDELLPLVVESLYLAAAISGQPESAPAPFALTANAFLQSMPSGISAILKVAAGPYTLSKTSLWDMDQLVNGWEATAAQATLSPDPNGYGPYWFPVALNQWAIYPKVTSSLEVLVTGITLPVTNSRPFSSTAAMGLQLEYADSIADCATFFARLKEAGPDFLESVANFDDFLSKMVELSRFSYRKGSLRFSRAMGVTAGLQTPRQK